MRALQLTRLDGDAASYPLRAKRTRIGRGAGNDIVLEDPRVHPTHLLLVEGETGLELHDLSGEGVLLNQRLVFAATVAAGDVLDLGRARLRLEVAPRLLQRLATDADSTHTQLRASRAASAAGAAVLRWRTRSGWHATGLEPGGTFLGSSASNHITLTDPTVSRWHARLSCERGAFTIVDLGSKNGTFVNGARVGRGPVPLGAELRLGGATLQLVAASATGSDAPLPGFAGLIGQSAPMRELFRGIERYAGVREPVLLFGETGTGKELVARALHTASTRNIASFVAVNCGALPRELVESELFGHERGAFSGAHSPRRGLFEEAHGGTLFLDEVAETSLETQAKLLRVLESGEVRRVGSNVPRTVDVRVVAACNQPLPELVTRGRFRLDLYHRLCVVELSVPPLRSRLEDLPLLARHLLSAEQSGRGKLLSDSSLALLSRQSWPGNIRELRNRLRRATLVAEGAMIEPEHLGLSVACNGEVVDTESRMSEPLAELERRHILTALQGSGGNKAEAARRLGIGRSTLFEKLRRYELA